MNEDVDKMGSKFRVILEPNKFFQDLHGKIDDEKSGVARCEFLLVRHALSNANVLFKYIVTTGKIHGASRL